MKKLGYLFISRFFLHHVGHIYNMLFHFPYFSYQSHITYQHKRIFILFSPFNIHSEMKTFIQRCQKNGNKSTRMKDIYIFLSYIFLYLDKNVCFHIYLDINHIHKKIFVLCFSCSKEKTYSSKRKTFLESCQKCKNEYEFKFDERRFSAMETISWW